jgi:hypothetical protein
MLKKHFFYRYITYAFFYFISGILIHFINFTDFKGGGGSGGGILIIGIILAGLLKGELGRVMVSIIAFSCGVAYLFKAKKYRHRKIESPDKNNIN